MWPIFLSMVGLKQLRSYNYLMTLLNKVVHDLVASPHPLFAEQLQLYQLAEERLFYALVRCSINDQLD